MSSTMTTSRPFEARVEILGQPHLARRLRARPVARHGDEIARHRSLDGAHQIGQEHERALEHGDEVDRACRRRSRGESPRHLGDPRLNLLPCDQHLHRHAISLSPRGWTPAARRRARARPSLGVAEHFNRPERQHLPVPHQHPPTHDRRPDVVAARHVDEMRNRVEHRRLPGAVHGDGDEIGLLAGSRLPMRSPCPIASAPRRVASSSTCRAGSACGSPVVDLVQQRGKPHGLEHVEVVVAGGAVRAEPGAHAARQPLRHGGDAARELHVALGIVRHADTGLRQDVHVGVVQPHRVRGDRTAVQTPERIQEARSATSRCASCIDLHLVPGLGEVDQQRHAVLVRQRARRLSASAGSSV